MILGKSLGSIPGMKMDLVGGAIHILIGIRILLTIR
jgi:putative Mn2+ efflux pump MntP